MAKLLLPVSSNTLNSCGGVPSKHMNKLESHTDAILQKSCFPYRLLVVHFRMGFIFSYKL